MNTKQLLNKYLYPEVYTNVRRKQFPYFDTVTMATGTTDYFFFNTPIAPFLRNKQLPVTGSEVFFIQAISAYPVLNHTTTAQVDALNELLQQSFLEIQVNNRLQMKLPGLDFINYQYSERSLSDQVVLTALNSKIGGNLNSDGFLGRKLPIPMIMNSNSNFQFRLNTPGDAVYSEIPFKLVLHGLQIDKLDTFQWDELKNFDLQLIPWTAYHTVPITVATQVTYPLFSNQATANNLISTVFPLSDIETLGVQAIEVFFNQPNTPIDPATIWNSRIDNELFIQIDDVIIYNGNLQNMLSVFAGFGQILTTTPNIDVVNIFNKRQTRILDIPIEFPANAKVTITLTQPANSLGITGEFTVAMRGIKNRRVA